MDTGESSGSPSEGATEDSSDDGSVDEESSDGSSSTGEPALPCSWVPSGPDVEGMGGYGHVECDAEEAVVVIGSNPNGYGCGDSVDYDRVSIRLPPSMQQVGEHDLAVLDARLTMGVDLGPASSQVSSGTLTIDTVTPDVIAGEVRASGMGELEGYDLVTPFEILLCPD